MLALPPLDPTPLPGRTVFADHLDPAVRYALPATLRCRDTERGAPDFFLLRYAGEGEAQRGGLLRVALELDTDDPPGDDAHPLPVPFERCELRLRLRSLGGDDALQTGRWHPTPPPDGGALSITAQLDAAETQLLAALLSAGDDVVEIELALGYRGLHPGLPWLVSADAARLATHLGALLGEPGGGDPDGVDAGGVEADRVIAAFLGLPDDLLSWRPLFEDVAAVPSETLRREAAHRALGRLFDEVDGRYRLRADLGAEGDGAPRLRWDLLAPRLEARSHLVRWSISELYALLTSEEERQALFPVVAEVNPFARVSVHLVNSLPFDPDYLQSVTAELRFPGPGGVPEGRSFSFDGSQDVRRFSTFHPSLSTPFTLEYRLSAILASADGGWPLVWQRDFAPADATVVEIDPVSADIRFVRVEVDARVFDHAATVEVLLAPPETPSPPLARLEVRADKPGAWIALPGLPAEAPLAVRCLAHPPAGAAGAPHTVVDAPLVDDEVRIHAFQLEPLDPDRIVVTLAPDSAGDFAFVALELAAAAPEAEGRLGTLEPGVPRVWTLTRRSVFEPLRYRYRTHTVARAADGSTRPMTVSDWTLAHTPSLTLHPEVPA